MSIICIIIAIASFVIGYVTSYLLNTNNFGTLHIDKTGEKDNYLFEIQDLNAIEKKSTIGLKIDLKE